MDRFLVLLLLCLLVFLTGKAGASPVEYRFLEPDVTTYRTGYRPIEKSYRSLSPVTRDTSGVHHGVLESVANGRRIHVGTRVIVRGEFKEVLHSLMNANEWKISRWLDQRTLVIEMGDVLAAIQLANALVDHHGIEMATPVRRHNARLQAGWSQPPSDPYFEHQYYLDATGDHLGVPPAIADMNARGAWAEVRGSSALIAIVDNGLDVGHAELIPNLRLDWNYNFTSDTTDARHARSTQNHGTAVAGLAAARGDNELGISGIAPMAGVCAFVVFDGNDQLADASDLAAALQFGLEDVAVQNHSWANADFDFLESMMIEREAMDRGATFGRGGRGVIYVLAAGNGRFRNSSSREGVGDANLNGFSNRPMAITVGAVRRDGRAASYSTPGDSVLVAAPGGESSESSQLFTLDPTGDAGRSTTANVGLALRDYLPQSRSVAGTSFATPLVSGTVALMLDARPELRWQDVQVLLALSARHFDRKDPDLRMNGSGLWYSRNTGYGVPDAGLAVRLARGFGADGGQDEVLDRERVVREWVKTGPWDIPDAGLHVRVFGNELPEEGLRIAARGGAGPFPDIATSRLPLIPVTATDLTDGTRLDGAGALVTRVSGDMAALLDAVADAGAAFTVIRNIGTTAPAEFLVRTDRVPIPFGMITGDEGQSLLEQVEEDDSLRVELGLDQETVAFDVPEGLVVEFVEVRVRMRHPRMGDVRVTMESPSGTRSVLQRPGNMTVAQIEDWTYGSKRHLLETGRGVWKVSFSDERPGMTGIVDEVTLRLHGWKIEDSDGNGLDDDWEMDHWEIGGQDSTDDEDKDGWSNAVEQYLGRNPRVNERGESTALQWVGDGRLRLSWPALPGQTYGVRSGTEVTGPFELPVAVDVTGREGVLFVEPTAGQRFFQLDVAEEAP